MGVEVFGSGKYKLTKSMKTTKSTNFSNFLHQIFQIYSKLIFDFTFSLVGLILVAPLLIVIGIAIKANSDGPILYKGLRTGRYGKPFYIYKFRSMVIGADKGAGTTSRNDPRLTSIGRYIRKYKLDEFPQLLNVLKGEMSFVGPRPELPRYTEKYQGKELLILTVKPGITDYSSLQFSNLNDLICDSEPDKYFENNILSAKNRLRIKYVETRTFAGDIKLIILTIFTVLRIK